MAGRLNSHPLSAPNASVRLLNGPKTGPPVALRVWLNMAGPGDLQLPEFPQVQLFSIDAPGVAACIHDQLHLADHAGHTAPPTPPRLRIFLRGRSTSISPTLA